MIAALLLLAATPAADPPSTSSTASTTATATASTTSASTTTTTTSTTTTTTPLPAGDYTLRLELQLRTHIPVIGDQEARATTVSALHIDDQGEVQQQNCWVDTTGPGYRVLATTRALQAMPRQRYRFSGVGDTVFADPGPLRFGDGDDDNDGAVGVAMELVIDALGRFTIQVQSDGHSRLSGVRTPTGAAGTVAVLYSRQKIVSGLPIVVDGHADVTAATFRIDRTTKGGCP